MSSKNKLSTLGFTLIELLVVISIIGLISTIVLVSTKGSRDKARLAKVKQFSSQVNHALGAYAVGIWRFEEGEGIDIHDESGYGNHGTFHGNPTPVFPDGVYSGTTALQFDGVDDYVDCPGPEVTGTDPPISYGAWIKTVPTNWRSAIYGEKDTDYSIQLAVNSSGTKVKGYMNIGSWHNVVDGNITPNEWHYVMVTYDGSYVRTYVDGMLHNAQDESANSFGGLNHLWIGSNERSQFFNGAIDEVRIYNRALSAAEIRNHYAAGAAKHGIAVNDR